MAITPEQNAQLEAIKQTLSGIDTALGSMSSTEKTKFNNSEASKATANALNATGAVLSSTSAKQAVDKGVATTNSWNSPYVGTNGEVLLPQATNSINQAFANTYNNERASAQVVPNVVSNTTSPQNFQNRTIPNIPQDNLGVNGTDFGLNNTNQASDVSQAVKDMELENDPMGKMLASFFNDKANLAYGQLNAMNGLIRDNEESAKKAMDLINKNTALQVERATKENERVMSAVRTAGIRSGQAMYAPEEHIGFVSETIQDGLMRIQEIENTGAEAIIKADTARRNFNYEVFTKMTGVLDKLTDLKRDTILDLNNRLTEIAKAEREKIKFDREESERNAFVFAPMLQGAPIEEVMKVADQYGIDKGLLLREVQKYANEQDKFDIDMLAKKESILTAQNSRYIASQNLALNQAKFQRDLNNDVIKAGEKKQTEILTPAQRKTNAENYPDLFLSKGTSLDDKQQNNLIPTDWSQQDLDNFVGLFGTNIPESDRARIIKQYNSTRGIISAYEANDEVTMSRYQNEFEKSKLPLNQVLDKATNAIVEANGIKSQDEINAVKKRVEVLMNEEDTYKEWFQIEEQINREIKERGGALYLSIPNK